MIGITSGMGVGDFPRPTQCKKLKKNFKLLKLEFPEGWGEVWIFFGNTHCYSGDYISVNT